MTFGDRLNDTARATGFLSRLPVPARCFEGDDGSLARATAMFPVAGALIGLCPGLVVLVLSATGANPALTALIALITLIGVTGALHEDGLADSADALGARRGREHMLEIMKDSRTGTYGVLALMCTFSLRVTALTIIVSATGGWNALLLVAATAAMSRAAMVWHWDQLPSARPGGVAASAGPPDPEAARLALGLGAGIFLVLAVWVAGLMAALVALLVAATLAWRWTGMVRGRLAGQTGDTIGATQQLAETGGLTALALLL